MDKLLNSRNSLYCILLLVFAFNLSSHTFAFWPGDNWWLRSAYWFIYLLLDASFIFGIFYLLKQLSPNQSDGFVFILATIISWLPFGLAISMLDIATGRPATSYAIRELQSTGFIAPLLWNMTVNILPRHIVFGTLMYLLHFHVRPGTKKAAEPSDSSNQLAFAMQAGFVNKLSTKVRAEPQLLQAQEHYLKVTTELGDELILYRFGQAVAEIPADYGVQIHRSFWVANSNVRGWSNCDNTIKVILHYGEKAPVSRRFEQHIKQHFQELN